MSGTGVGAPALSPISIAIEELKVSKRSNAFSVAGIDLESGHRVTLELTTDGDPTPYLSALPSGLLVLAITIERVLLA